MYTYDEEHGDDGRRLLKPPGLARLEGTRYHIPIVCELERGEEAVDAVAEAQEYQYLAFVIAEAEKKLKLKNRAMGGRGTKDDGRRPSLLWLSW